MKIRSLIAGAAAALVVLLVMAAATVWLVVEQIKMGGPLQVQSQLASDYMADILPPPEYIIEPYLEATLVLAHPAEVAARGERLAALHRSYDERHEYWLVTTMDAKLRDQLTITTNAPAQQFWKELETRFLPAIKAGRTEEAGASYRRLASAYDRHRAAIDLAVTSATEFQTALKASSSRSVRNAQIAAAGAAIALLAGLVGFLWMINRRAIAPLNVAASNMQRLSAGDYTAATSVGTRRDEIGALNAGLETFRLAAIAKRDAENAKISADREQKHVVDTVSRHLADLAGGDMTATIHEQFPPDYSVLRSNFNDALDKLRTLIGSVGDSAAAIRLGSGEIAQASEDLARRTEGSAASLEQAAVSLSAVDDRIKASADVASQTVARADQAIATVGGGRSKASEARQAMDRVSGSARGIDDVIEGLDKIAFQTRVLAMNAAVEAGRAGDAGRGFAVVADLVSALAMRAEEEAKRARNQLTVTQADIITAVDAVTLVDEALSDISSDVGHVHQLLATMASDNRIQSAAISEIAAAVGLMDRSTQQNAAMVEQTSAAARNLANEVGGLTQQASRFKLGRDAAGAGAGAGARAGAGRRAQAAHFDLAEAC